MEKEKKDSYLTYFKFFYGILGFRIFVNFALNILIGLFDGIGITVIFPLLQSFEGGAQKQESLGQMRYLFYAFEKVGIPQTVTAILVLFLILFIIKGIVRYFAHLYQSKLYLSFVRKVQMNLLDDLKGISYPGYLRFDAGKIQNTLVAEVMRLSEAMKGFFKWSNSLVMLLTYVVMAYLANPGFALLITIGVSIMNFIYRRLFRMIKAASYETSKTGSDLNSFLIELVHNFKYLKSTSRLGQYANRLRGVINNRYNINYRIEKLYGINISVKEPTIVFMLVLVMMIQINYFGSGIGSIILSLVLFYRGLGFLLALQGDWQYFLLNSGSFRMVNEVAEEMKGHKEAEGAIAFQSLKSEIRVKNVSLSFGRNKVLNDVTISIPRNTTTALTGVSGSGKTTLINIISGILTPDEGKVLVDGIKLSDFDTQSYRNKIGYISQESVVFNDTIFNNVTFWAEPTPENKKRFWEVADMASLKEFIENQDKKEHTLLGNNGALISGGQKQRISIARELFKNPEILVLDEATSALDSETEQIIQNNIESLQGHYTIIIIAHRLSTVKNADNIYLLERGRVIHSGKFNEMIEGSTKFQSLVSLQGL